MLNELKEPKEACASSGNRTRATRVAGEHSTTEPTMLSLHPGGLLQERIRTDMARP